MTRTRAAPRIRLRTVLPFVWLAAAAALAVWLLGRQQARLHASERALSAATWWLLPVLLLLEGASLLSYAELVRTLLRSMGQHAPRGLLGRVVLAGTALGRSLPGGTTVALAAVVSALRRAGLRGGQAAAALAASGLLSAAVLALLLPLAALLSLIGRHGGGVALGAAGMAVAVVATAAVVRPALRHPEALGRLAGRLAALVLRGPLRRRLDPATVGGTVEQAVRGLDDVAGDRRVLGRAAGWAAGNWLLDMAVLVLVAATVGHGVPLEIVPLAYVAGQWIAALPLTPGGVGAVELAMTGVLTLAGAPSAAAGVTVLGWRLLSNYLPILVGLPLVPTLGAGARVTDRSG
ncbi:MAG TPA: flippase-like domain-containing protein [Actinomycetes bacterium]|nr:flippase-like domain-containing protein [Actinomycetes bacterium]